MRPVMNRFLLLASCSVVATSFACAPAVDDTAAQQGELACDDASPLGDTLSSTGFFGAGVERYDALAALWSDGADKQRYVKLPCDAQIDTSNVDEWIFPRGTTLWKEFVVDGTKVETRVFKKVGDDDALDGSWDFSAYAWNDDATDAVQVPNGAVHEATGWEIPARSTCMECHANIPGRVIGFSALQLGHATVRNEAITLASLVDDGRITHAPPRAMPAVHEWSSVAKTAQLALHASCGHCHREGGPGAVSTTGEGVPGLVLDVRFEDGEATSAAARTAVNVALVAPLSDDVTMRIVAGDPGNSGLFHRMTNRGDWTQMPPLATNVVDDEAAAAVQAWIDTL
jgi:hypothetical protein